MLIRTAAAYTKSVFNKYPVVTITGPRQSGKTTLAKMCFPELVYRNLENPETRLFAREDPVAFLRNAGDQVIIDEIQYVPELSSYIQSITDEKKENGLYVLTGSQQFNMLETVSQSLAGRTGIIKLLPFSMEEVMNYYTSIPDSTNDFIYRGFYPRIFDQQIDPSMAYPNYVETYIERDLRQLSQVQDLMQFQKFMKLCAGRIGQVINYSNLANDTGISHKTAEEWLSLLETSFIIYRLPPYFANIRKRLIKSPKLYFYDTGLASHLIGIEHPKQIETHPLRGQLFENMVITEVLKYRYNHGKTNNLSFYRDAKGHEVDLLYNQADINIPIEIKAASTIRTDQFKGLEYFSSYIQMSDKKILVYDGDRDEQRTKAVVTNPKKLLKWLSD